MVAVVDSDPKGASSSSGEPARPAKPARPGLRLAVTGGGDPRVTREVSLALSPSRASDFMRCPLLFRYRALDRIPERPSSAAVRGTLVHAVLERIFDLPAPQRTLPAAVALLTPTWQDLLAGEPDLICAVDSDAGFPSHREALSTGELESRAEMVSQWLASAQPLLKTYFDLEQPSRLRPSARELAISVELADGTPLRGVIDRLETSAAGWLRVVDYKTGRSPGEGFEQRAMFQMQFYALMLWRSRGSVPKRLQLLYLGDGQTLTYEPSAVELERCEHKLRALWSTILKVLEVGQWEPRPSRMCDWCDHQSRCPARGGTQAAPLLVHRLDDATGSS